ncbi:uncharacterized protein F5Z01DRAFT_631334 [Emericellopsis atlantica]|uniref:Uncharacterized protein n=1 Tax=Emericellopsis atlantica TaxID=2614577 RepID=A0A9P7ZDE2_9HYPO|nr:uncharacterized protein F5Z01DRAFT_631334 [Emericellopsis atlantica]KAG9249632.1 hypothetical protein F5Z01DRAFT_631334 [Emericellopsis atlantica]
MPTSVRQLASAAHVDEETVQAYLELLRAQSTRHADIASTRSLNEGPIDIRNEGLEQPVIIPCQDGTAWAFAVAYPDCVHWYDSRPNASIPNLATTPRPIVANWTGPKVSQDRVDDAGVLALIGIRQIHQGAPHMSQECANELVSSFRARLIAELTCGELEPSAEAFAAMAPAEAERVAPPIHTESSSPVRPLSAGTRVQPGRDDRRTILGHLCEAVLSYRAIQGSDQLSLAMLWQSVKRGATGSTFHKRLNCVRFCERMDALDDAQAVGSAMRYPVDRQSLLEMRDMQTQCQFWRDVCDLRLAWGPDKFVLLLAIPRIPSIRRLTASRKQQILTGLRARLDDSADSLQHWLQQSQRLCRAVVTGALPADNLMIDIYGLKKPQNVSDSDYEMYTSGDPRAKRALPRRGTARST